MPKLMGIALAILLANLCGVATAQHDISRHESPAPSADMTVTEVIGLCNSAIEAAETLESDAYSIYHNDFRWCLSDLRSRIDQDSAQQIGLAATRWLETDDPVIQMHAVLMLGATRYEAAFSQVVELLSSDDWRVGYGAALALAAIADEDQIPTLVTALENSRTGQQFYAIYDALLVANGEPPFIDEEREYFDSISDEERTSILNNLEETRAFLQMTFRDPEIGRQAQLETWAGGVDIYGEPMAIELTPEGRPLTSCPGMVFEFDGDRRIELADHSIANMTRRESLPFGSGELSFEIDANPQYMGQFPGQLEWTDLAGDSHVLTQRAVFHVIQLEGSPAVIAGPGSGPSSGTLFAIEESSGGRPILRRLFEIPVTPLRLRRLSETEFLAVSLYNAAVVFDIDGAFTMGRCFRDTGSDLLEGKPE